MSTDLSFTKTRKNTLFFFSPVYTLRGNLFLYSHLRGSSWSTWLLTCIKSRNNIRIPTLSILFTSYNTTVFALPYVNCPSLRHTLYAFFCAKFRIDCQVPFGDVLSLVLEMHFQMKQAMPGIYRAPARLIFRKAAVWVISAARYGGRCATRHPPSTSRRNTVSPARSLRILSVSPCHHRGVRAAQNADAHDFTW